MRVEYDARYLMAICDHSHRRYLLVRETWLNPTRAVALKGRVIELHNQCLQGAQEVGHPPT